MHNSHTNTNKIKKKNRLGSKRREHWFINKMFNKL